MKSYFNSIKNFIEKEKKLLIILVFLLPLYTVGLSSFPTSVHGDEAETALQAIQIVNGKAGLIGVGWFDLPLLSFLPHGLSMLFLGKTIVANRLASVFFGILSLPIYYFFLKHWFNKKLATIALILFGTSHLWISLSRLGLQYAQSTFFILVVLFVLIKALSFDKRWFFIASGALFGLSMYSYYGVRVLPIFVTFFFIRYLFTHYSLKHKLIRILLFSLAAIIIFLPQGLFYLKYPYTFASREKAIFIFSESAQGWTNYHKDNLGVLFEQTKRTVNVLAGDNSTQYRFQGSLLDIFSIVFFLAGVTYALFKIKEYKYKFMFLWFFLALLGQILTSIPPPIFLPRFVVGLPVLYFFISLGIVKVIEKANLNKKMSIGLISFVVLIIVLFNLFAYFVSYPNQLTGDPNARAATKIAKILNSDYKYSTIYFYTSPSLYAGFSTLSFLSPGVKKINLDSTIKPKKMSIASHDKLVYVIYPQFKSLIEDLSSLYKYRKVRGVSENNGNIQFYILELSDQ